MITLPIDVHVIKQHSSTLFDECLKSIPSNVNLYVVDDAQKRWLMENRAAGFSMGKSPWVSYVDYDDLVVEHAFDKLYGFAESNQYSAVFGNSIIERDGRLAHQMFNNHAEKNPNDMIMNGATGVHQLYLVDRSIMEKSIPMAVVAVNHQSTFDFVLTCAVSLFAEWQFLDEITYKWRIQQDSLHKSLHFNKIRECRQDSITKLKKMYALQLARDKK